MIKMQFTHKKALTGQRLLLEVIWKLNGGNTRVAKKIGVHKQTPINWRLRGKVPLNDVGFVSKKLKVLMEALNFEGMKSLGSNLCWTEVVDWILKDTPWYADTKLRKLLLQQEKL